MSMFGFITPKVGLAFIKKKLESTCDFEISKFDIFWHKDKQGMKFVLYSDSFAPDEKPKEIFFKDESTTVSNFIKFLIEKEINQTVEIDAFLVSVLNKDVEVTVWFQKTTLKGKKEIVEKIKNKFSLTL